MIKKTYIYTTLILSFLAIMLIDTLHERHVQKEFWASKIKNEWGYSLGELNLIDIIRVVEIRSIEDAQLLDQGPGGFYLKNKQNGIYYPISRDDGYCAYKKMNQKEFSELIGNAYKVHHEAIIHADYISMAKYSYQPANIATQQDKDLLKYGLFTLSKDGSILHRTRKGRITYDLFRCH